MRVEPFDRDSHGAMIGAWCRERGVPATILDMLPAHGYVVDGVAAGFLYETDSVMALIEGIIANPGVGSHDRDQALDEIFRALIDSAQRLGYSVVWGFTTRPEVAERARRLGFDLDDAHPYTFGTRRI